MKVRRLELKGRNTGLLKEAHISKSCKDKCGYVLISKGYFSRCGDSSPLFGRDEKHYVRNHFLKFKNKIIYALDEFGTNEKGRPVYVGFNWFQHQRFLWMQKEHWFQQESNLRYVVNVIFLIIGAYLGFKGLVK